MLSVLRSTRLALPTIGRSSSSSAGDLTVAAALRPSRDPWMENLRLRRQLAVSYRVLALMGLNEGACNHLSVTAPSRSGSGQRVMLLAPGFMSDGSSQHWMEVSASSLIGVDDEGRVIEEGSLGGEAELSSVCIHLGVRKVRPDAGAIFHLHAPYSTAQGCLTAPELLPLHQNSLRFLFRSEYYKEYGVPNAFEEGLRIGKSLGKKDILFMANHGTLVVSPHCHIAFDECYYLERACQYQMLAMAAVGGDSSKLKMVDQEALEYSTDFFTTSDFLEKYSAKHFYSYWNKLVHEKSDVFN